MTETYEFKELSQRLHQHYQKGDWKNAAETLNCMAGVLHSEEHYRDEMKTRMLGFYIDLSGIQQQPFIRSGMINLIQDAYRLSGMNEVEVKELYFDTIRHDTLPHHSMTLNGTYRVFCYCLFGKHKKIQEVLVNLSKSLNKVD